MVTAFDYGDRVLEIHALLADAPLGEVRTDGDRPWRWVTLEELLAAEMPPANEHILRALHWRLTGRPVPPRDV